MNDPLAKRPSSESIANRCHARNYRQQTTASPSGKKLFARLPEGHLLTLTSRVSIELPDRWLKPHPDCKWGIDAIRREERPQIEARKRQLKRRKKSR
jgi:hypothetical protein